MTPENIPFQNTFAQLPQSFYSKKKPPTPVKKPLLKAWNSTLATELKLGFDPQTESKELASLFSGNQIAKNSIPLATAYAGHQFGHFNPHLGDGRAHLLGELYSQDKTLFDIQLKGSGRTPYSRQGDGRSPLGPVIREYLISEAMHSLGVPTTRSLALVETGETVQRETLLPGAILTRVAQNHIRVGHFEYFAFHQDSKSLNTLIKFVIDRSYPELQQVDNKPLELFKKICEKQAQLVALWMSLGFIHGVMNTDNTSAIGITIDYGPCAFLDETDFNKVFSFIDHQGRYAYKQQPQIMQWNLTRLAESLLVSYDKKETEKQTSYYKTLLENFVYQFEKEWQNIFLKKIGFDQPLTAEENKILPSFLDLLIKNKIDFTHGFRNLPLLLKSDHTPNIFNKIEGFTTWSKTWKSLIKKYTQETYAETLMNSVNPAIIPRNHIVERVIQSCYKSDYSEFEKLLKALQTPYKLDKESEKFTTLPQSHEVVTQTFCGT